MRCGKTLALCVNAAVFLVVSFFALGFLTPTPQPAEAAVTSSSQAHSMWDNSGLDLPDEFEDGDVALRHRSQDADVTAISPPSKEAMGSSAPGCHASAPDSPCQVSRGCVTPLVSSPVRVLRC
ncbi:hypothetical protein [Streptomyces sp. NPDC002044]|uniref:hypothetical protein n=1 Tax=Streptomyces sp. NPDC002044 TaxID=3154662 RepID=UPI0033276E1B